MIQVIQDVADLTNATARTDASPFHSATSNFQGIVLALVVECILCPISEFYG